MDIQRLRNLTTGILHTEIGHVYEDIEFITRTQGLMTHQIPNAGRALKPWLQERFPDERLWDEKFDTSHVGEVDVPQMDDAERHVFFQRVAGMPDPLAGKDVIVVKVD